MAKAMGRMQVILVIATCAIAAEAAMAAPITLVPGTVNMFRDTRGLNDVGIVAGDRLQFGASIQGGSAGTSIGASYPPLPGLILNPAQLVCNPLTVGPNFCARSVAFAANRIAQPWDIRFTNGPDSLVVTGPSLAGTENPVPFPVNVTIANSGLAPTINWTIPNSFAPDGFRISIYDKNLPLVRGQADVIHNDTIAANAASFTIPLVLDGNRRLSFGGNYTIGLQVIETRAHVPFTGNNAQILRDSSSYFSFTPLTNTAPPEVFLPTVGIDTNPNDNRAAPFRFFVTNVGPSRRIFIDPLLAIGYDYAIGAGDPNFASVILPDIGDGVFELSFLLGGVTQTNTVNDGDQFFFPAGGVDVFSVRGIEIGAGLDPADATAFITGLTFVSTGDFTGTQTPITQFVDPAVVPEPGTLLLLGFGFAALACRRRRTA